MSYFPHPPATSRATRESLISHLLMNMQVFLSASLWPILLSFPPGSRFPPSLFFTMCSEGERPATPLRWVALNEEKKRGREKKKSCPVLPLMSKSMHLSLKRRREWERERSYWDPGDQAKTLTQKQLPHAMNRSLFKLSTTIYQLRASHWTAL